MADPLSLPVDTQAPAGKNSGGDGPAQNATTTTAAEDGGDDNYGEQRQRLLRRKKKKHHKGKWIVFGTTSKQEFDPLQYSFTVGDYPDGGTASGGRWADEM